MARQSGPSPSGVTVRYHLAKEAAAPGGRRGSRVERLAKRRNAVRSRHPATAAESRSETRGPRLPADATTSQTPSSRAMMVSWISVVPSVIVINRASRQ